MTVLEKTVTILAGLLAIPGLVIACKSLAAGTRSNIAADYANDLAFFEACQANNFTTTECAPLRNKTIRAPPPTKMTSSRFFKDCSTTSWQTLDFLQRLRQPQTPRQIQT